MEIGLQLGAYRIERLLGRGGMAEVYRVWNTGLQRHEALKMLPPQMTFDRSFVDRFLNEARMAAGLHHPNIATIYAVSELDATQPYFAMELVEGEDLADLLRRRGSLPLPEALHILFQIAEALDYAHQHGVVHRDVKPANVLLRQTASGSWDVKVVDFGIARAQEAEGGTRLTKTGMIVGTPEYMSPEQGGSGEKVDHRSDQYSLGAVAYEMLCGQPPFRAMGDSSPISVIVAHLRELPAPPVNRVPGLPRPVNEAILKALAKHPAERWASCRAFAEGCSGMGLATQLGPRVRRPKTFLPAALIGAVGLGITLVGLSLSRNNETMPETTSATPVSSASATKSDPEPLPDAATLGVHGDANTQSIVAPVPVPEPIGWQTWHGDGFTLDYPSNWALIQKMTTDGPRVQFNAPEPNVSVLVDTSIAGSGVSPLAQWQDMDRRLRQAHGPNYQLNSLGSSSVDGDAAAVWVFTLMRKDQSILMKKTDIGVNHEGHGYALLLSAPAASYNSWQGQFAHVQSSFHVVSP